MQRKAKKLINYHLSLIFLMMIQFAFGGVYAHMKNGKNLLILYSELSQLEQANPTVKGLFRSKDMLRVIMELIMEAVKTVQVKKMVQLAVRP